MSVATIISPDPFGERIRGIPPLIPGDSLSQKEFARRLEAYSEGARFELIEGIVYMSPPATSDHGDSDYKIAAILSAYEEQTPGVRGWHNTSVKLDSQSQPMPDAILTIEPEYGGNSRVIDNYVSGPPELVLEVAYTSENVDLHAKRREYARTGILEYVVVCLRERKLRWFDLARGKEIRIAKDGILKSLVFPGLWFDVAGLLAQDLRKVLATVRMGLATPEHVQFVSRLAARRAAMVGKKPGNIPGLKTRKNRKAE